MVRKDHEVHKESKECRVPKEFKDIQDHKDLLELQVGLATLDILVEVVLRLLMGNIFCWQVFFLVSV